MVQFHIFCQQSQDGMWTAMTQWIPFVEGEYLAEVAEADIGVKLFALINGVVEFNDGDHDDHFEYIVTYATLH